MILPKENLQLVRHVACTIGEIANGKLVTNLASLCRSKNINPWSRRKPVKLSESAAAMLRRNGTPLLGIAGWEKGYNGCYGFEIPECTMEQIAAGANWKYAPPGGGASEPFCLGFFAGYDTGAVPFMLSPYGMSRLTTTGGGAAAIAWKPSLDDLPDYEYWQPYSLYINTLYTSQHRIFFLLSAGGDDDGGSLSHADFDTGLLKDAVLCVIFDPDASGDASKMFAVNADGDSTLWEGGTSITLDFKEDPRFNEPGFWDCYFALRKNATSATYYPIPWTIDHYYMFRLRTYEKDVEAFNIRFAGVSASPDGPYKDIKDYTFQKPADPHYLYTPDGTLFFKVEVYNYQVKPNIYASNFRCEATDMDGDNKNPGYKIFDSSQQEVKNGQAIPLPAPSELQGLLHQAGAFYIGAYRMVMPDRGVPAYEKIRRPVHVTFKYYTGTDWVTLLSTPLSVTNDKDSGYSGLEIEIQE